MTTARKLWGGFGLLVALLVVTGLSITLWLNGFKRELENITGVHEIVAVTLLLLVAGVLISGGTALAVSRRMLRSKTQLRESEEQVRLLLESSSEGIYSIDRAGNCTFANPACATLLGYDDPRDLLGKNMHDVIHSPPPNGTSLPQRGLPHLPGPGAPSGVAHRRRGLLAA